MSDIVSRSTPLHVQLFNQYKGSLTNPEWYCKKGFDPLIVILKQYDNLIGQLLRSDINLFLATGLHQQPHKNLTFYWRINKHNEFVSSLKIKGVKEVLPRMSRDFLIDLVLIQKKKAEEILNSFIIQKDKAKVFNVDNRGSSLFVELIYIRQRHSR